ncbi:MAG: RluA family pseudouridine synthase [Thermodesulfovibrionales bacterium]
MLIRASREDSAAKPRLDRFLSEKTSITRSQIQRLLESGAVLVNGEPARANRRVREGDAVEISLPEKQAGGLPAEDIPVGIFHMDGDVAVVDKPAGMVVYPSHGHASGTLMNALAFRAERLASVGGPLRPGVVHRLDKDTSGVMVVALSDTAYYRLVEDFKARRIKRSYLALVFGSLRGESGEMAMSIGRSPSDRKKMSTRARRGREAVTRWQVVERFRDATLVKARLETGRTHQIRVHFAASGHPVLGDRTYGRKGHITTHRAHRAVERIVFPRQMLHAEVLGFEHPATGQWMEFRSPLPEDMALAIQRLREAEAAQGSG